jgi:hypothetical protein
VTASLAGSALENARSRAAEIMPTYTTGSDTI